MLGEPIVNTGIVSEMMARQNQISGNDLESHLKHMAEVARTEAEQKIIDEGNFEYEKTQAEFEQEQALQMVAEAKSMSPQTPDQERIARLEAALEMLADKVKTQSFGAQASHEAIWAKSMAEGKTHVELDAEAWAGLSRMYPVAPPSVSWKNIFFYPPGTMEKRLKYESTHVDVAHRGVAPKEATRKDA